MDPAGMIYKPSYSYLDARLPRVVRMLYGFKSSHLPTYLQHSQTQDPFLTQTCICGPSTLHDFGALVSGVIKGPS